MLPIEKVVNDVNLQRHWVYRVVAFVIDAFLVLIPFLIFGLFLHLLFPKLFNFFWWAAYGACLWLYSALLEHASGRTIGKALLSLRAEGKKGKLDFATALIRNLSKIFPVLLFLDWLVGMVTDGDPRQRYLDRLLEVTVRRTDVTEDQGASSAS
ncbi:MAG: RDD family protein [Thermoplasmata archaeon]